MRVSHTLLKVDMVPSGSDPVPSPLTVAEGTLVGRIPGGAIAALTIEQIPEQYREQVVETLNSDT